MPHTVTDLAAAFRLQASYCEDLGSPLWARLMRRTAGDIEADGRFAHLLANWSGDLARGALPLRLFGGLHYLALAGRAPDLATHLPSTGGQPRPDLWTAVLGALTKGEDVIRQALDRPPQTNEVRRASALIGGFLRIARATGLPLRLCEIGASAGLNLCCDRFSYELGPHRWPGRDPHLTIAADWRGGQPDIGASLAIAGRQGCDLRPIDLADPAAHLWLQAYVWPDQPLRLALLRAAIATAIEMRIQVEQASAGDWVIRMLSERLAGQTTVIYHSLVLQYLARAERQSFIAALAAAGAEATAERPLAWLRLEQEQADARFALRLTLWPGGKDELLALADPHGRWVDWRA